MPALLILWFLYSLRGEPGDSRTTRCERSPGQRRRDEEDGIALEVMLLSTAFGAGTLGALILVRLFVRWLFGSWLSWATMIGPGVVALVTAIAYVAWQSWSRGRRLLKAK